MAVAFSWTGYVDTDLAFSEFFNGDHTITLRYMPQYPKGYEGPCVAENGTGTFALGQGTYSLAPEKSSLPSLPQMYFAVADHSTAIKAANLEPNRWYHLTVVSKDDVDARYFNLYLNAKWMGLVAVKHGAPGWPSGTLRFGKRTTGQTINQRNAQFYGLLADVAIYTRALTAEEIATLAASSKGFTGSETGLLAAYPLSPGATHPKLTRPVTLHGLTKMISTSANGDNAADAALIPLQTRQQPMDLPFKPGEVWVTGQAWDGEGSHNGLAEFCWDLTRHEGGTNGVPIYAAAPGEVEVVRESAPSGESEYANHVDVKQAENEYASYIHLKQNSVPVAKDDLVTQGQEIGQSGDTGTPVNNFHLHFAVSDKRDQANGFVTIPVAFSDYEVLAGTAWKVVARGAPKSDDIIRNPVTPKFAAKSIGPGSVVSRGANLLDLVATDNTGRIWIARWTPNRYVKNWDRWRPVLSDLGATRPVAVASRSSTRLDIVSTHAVGTIHTGGWNEQYNYGLWGGWWQIKDFVAKANAPVSIVARDSEKLDVFSVRNDGAVMTAAWEQDVDDGAWRGWWQIADGVTVPGGWITVVSRAANKLDVFMVGKDGGVYTAAWEHGVARGAWRGWWRIKDLESVPGSYVAAVSRHPDKLDVVAVRTDGAILTAAWEQGIANSAWRGWWSVANGHTTPGVPVTAVSRHPDKLDVFVIRNDGGVYTAAWAQGVQNSAWQGWWRIKDLVAYPTSAVAAVSRDPDKLDIFAARNDQIFTAAWDRNQADGAWQGWWRIG